MESNSLAASPRSFSPRSTPRSSRCFGNRGATFRLIGALIVLAAVALAADVAKLKSPDGQATQSPSASPMDPSHQLFVGVKGTVLAIDRTSGQEVWRSRLKGSGFVNVVLNDGNLYAATNGELFCLEVATGQVRWHSPLKGLGRGLVTIAGNQQTVVLRAKREKDEAADGTVLMMMAAMM